MFVTLRGSRTVRGSRRRQSSCARTSSRRVARSSRHASREERRSASGSASSCSTVTTMTPWAEAALFAAARAQLADEVIRPALAARRRRHLRPLRRLVARVSGCRARARRRARARAERRRSQTSCPTARSSCSSIRRPRPAAWRGQPDRIEREGDGFRAACRRATGSSRARFPERVRLLDGSRDPDELADRRLGGARGV